MGIDETSLAADEDAAPSGFDDPLPLLHEHRTQVGGEVPPYLGSVVAFDQVTLGKLGVLVEIDIGPFEKPGDETLGLQSQAGEVTISAGTPEHGLPHGVLTPAGPLDEGKIEQPIEAP